MTSWWLHNDIISPPNQCFLVFSYFCAEGQHSQKLIIKNTWALCQTINLDFTPSKSYECSELENEKWGRWHLLNANCSQLCVYFLSYFSRKGSKIYQINKKLQQKKLGKSKINYFDVIPRFYNMPLNLYDVIGDVTGRLQKSEITFFFETIVFKVTKILDPKHHSPI